MSASKDDLRRDMLALRNGLEPFARAEKSAQIMQRLSQLPLFQQARRVLFYYAFGSEPDTRPFLEACLTEKEVYLPALLDDTAFAAAPVHAPLRLKKGRMGVMEPEAAANQPHPPLDLILVPGLAFGHSGFRVGTGKGYYDRFLKHYSGTPRLGLAFDFQVLDEVPKDPYDVPVDLIVTESYTYDVRRNQTPGS